jgi:hypothetical protein
MKLTIPKLDAAKRQLETAIRLYFSSADPVAVHTLTAAAYNVIRDVTAKLGAEPMLVKGTMLDFVRPEYKDALIQKVNEAENFFKHADRDHDATLDFDPAQSEMLIIDACNQYEKLTGERPPLFGVYKGWFMAAQPEFYKFPEEFSRAVRANAPEILRMGRAAYFSMALPQLMKLGV